MSAPWWLMRSNSLLVALLAAPALVALVPGCAQVDDGCRCSGPVGPGSIDAACGESQCIGGTQYRCVDDMSVTPEGACDGPTPVPHLRPADAPDFVIIGASGHCFDVSCAYNEEYLAVDGTLAVIADRIALRGRSVQYEGFADSLYDMESTSTGETLALGFLTMLETLAAVRDAWIADFDNPTRVIVIGHSHGTVWAHLALMVLERAGRPIPVDILIDLDGISIGWEDDVGTAFIGDIWSSELIAYTESSGMSWPLDVWNAADAIYVPGVAELQDVEDVVPDSVLANLEVWSSDDWGVRDSQPNWRLDGSMAGIFRGESVENHGDTSSPSSDAMQWVIATIDEAYEW